jgi:hypothetical protein
VASPPTGNWKGGFSVTDKVKNWVFCPLSEQLDMCKQTTKKIDHEAKVTEVQVVTCGFWSEGAGRCSIGLLAEGLKSLMQQADRIANAAEAIYAVMDPEDDGE